MYVANKKKANEVTTRPVPTTNCLKRQRLIWNKKCFVAHVEAILLYFWIAKINTQCVLNKPVKRAA